MNVPPSLVEPPVDARASVDPRRYTPGPMRSELIAALDAKSPGPTLHGDVATLVLIALVGIASRVVEPTGPRLPLTFAGRPMPSLCLIRRATGRRCLSCGLTRGVIYAMRLDFRNSVRANRIAPLALVLMLGRSAVALRRLKIAIRRPPSPTGQRARG
jgi:Protein of unknown function (DUF2752)